MWVRQHARQRKLASCTAHKHDTCLHNVARPSRTTLQLCPLQPLSPDGMAWCSKRRPLRRTRCERLHLGHPNASCPGGCAAQVQYAALSHFEERYEDFMADTVVLRRRFSPDGGWAAEEDAPVLIGPKRLRRWLGPGGLQRPGVGPLRGIPKGLKGGSNNSALHAVRPSSPHTLSGPPDEETLLRGDEKLPGDSFALSIRNIWEVIRSQKDLNLPAHKVQRNGTARSGKATALF